MLENRSRIRTPGHVEDVAHGFLVGPTGGKLGLTGLTGAVPVTATAIQLAVEYVCGPFGTGADGLHGRAVGGVYRVPARSAGTSRLGGALLGPGISRLEVVVRLV
jgi:hypothetical protein